MSDITVNTKDFTLTIPDLGISLRRIMGAAAYEAEHMEPFRRRWSIIYKGSKIGNINLAHIAN
jgi:hypothetical protein